MPRYSTCLALGALALIACQVRAEPVTGYLELDPARIASIAAMLPSAPTGIGRPISDRTYWNSPAIRDLAGDPIPQAEKLLARPFPAWSDDDYLDFSRTGQRPRGEAMIRSRNAWLKPLVLAECLENKGRFLPAIRLALQGYVSQPTWTLPAHDGDLKCFHQTKFTVDLGASSFGADLAETVWLLEDKLDAGLRQRLIDAIDQRCLIPVRQSLATGAGNGWLGSASHSVVNNWNAVCLSGVVGAALAITPDRQERATFAAAGEHYINYYLNSFHPSGYIDEGGGYWSYGFGHLAVLRETLVRATAGQIDLFDLPRIHESALFGPRYQLTDHQMPTFADCRWGTRADASLIGYYNKVLNLQLPDADAHPKLVGGSLYSALLTPTPLSRPPQNNPRSEPDLIGIRSYFNDVGVLVSRPSSPQCEMGVAIKAGGNSSHSHNDIGSFVITLGKEMPVGDPGGPFAYDSKTFGPDRYKVKLLNSFGHPVPVVAGQLQRDATKVKPKVLHTDFTDDHDEITIDLTPAYDAPGLISLKRTLRYQRGGTGSVILRDEVAFSQESTFEPALTTHGTVTVLDDRHLLFTQGSQHLLAAITTPDGFKITTEQITDLAAPTFTRVGFVLSKPVKSATVQFDFTKQ